MRLSQMDSLISVSIINKGGILFHDTDLSGNGYFAVKQPDHVVTRVKCTCVYVGDGASG
jgi:hypothetical protein